MTNGKELFGGVIYSRVLINPEAKSTGEYGKPYVGKTEDMTTRDQSWKNKSNKRYGGTAITEAREKWGVSDDSWKTTILERVYADTKEELKGLLKAKETEWITKLNSVEEGYNGSYGDGGLGIAHDEERKAKDSKASTGRKHTEEAKARISQKMMGHEVSTETREKISKGNSGKERTAEMRQAQSERMKGHVPTAAVEGAAKWRETHQAYWKGKEMPAEAKAKMKAIQQERGTAVVCHCPDGSTIAFNTMLDAEKAFGVKAGSIANNLRHSSEQYKTKTGYWFERV